MEEVGGNGVKEREKGGSLLFLEENLEYARNMFRSLHFASNACGSLLNEQEHQTTQRLQRQRPAHGDFSGHRHVHCTDTMAQRFNMSTYRLDLLHMADHHAVAGDLVCNYPLGAPDH